MSERFRERLGYLSEELDSHLRSTSPAGSRSPRRNSRSPRPPNRRDQNIAIAIPLIRDSRPEIAAWPAPPAGTPLIPLSGNVRTITTAAVAAMPQQTPAPAQPPLSPPQASPASSSSFRQHSEFEESNTLLSMLRVAAASSTTQPKRENELKRKIQTLEETVAEYERQKYNVMGTFSEYREHVAERERTLEAEYSTKIIALSEEVLGAKKDYETKMKSFQALQDKFEREKEQALEKLRQEHQKEIQLLEERFSESQLLNLEQKYIIEIQRLEEERKSLRSEKERLGETFEMKLRRAQSLYETELTAAKMMYSKELEALRDHEEALKEELLARQDEFHDRLQELQIQTKRGRDELATCKSDVSALEKKLQSKEAEVMAISKELSEARTETNDSLMRLSQATHEFNQFKQLYHTTEDELKNKSRLLDVVEVAKAKLESVIRDLQTEVRVLKSKVEFLEKERENLESQSESQAQLSISQVDALEAVLVTVNMEKESTRDHYEGMINREKQQAEAREHAMKKEFSSKLNELEEQYTSLKEDLEHSARLDKDELVESTQHEIHTLRTEKALLESQLKALEAKFLGDDDNKDELTSHLTEVMEKTDELTKIIDSYRERLAHKDEEMENLRKRLEREPELNEEQILRLRKELTEEIMNGEVADKLSQLEDLKQQIKDYDKYQEQEECRRKEAEKEIKLLKKKNDELKKDVGKLNDVIAKQIAASDDAKDEEIATVEASIREECSVVIESKEEKCRLLMEEMEELKYNSDQKTLQLETLHSRVTELTDQMSSIRQELDKKNVELKQIGQRTDEYLKKRELQHNSAGETKISHLQRDHEKAIQTLKDREQELLEKIEELQKTNVSEEEGAALNEKLEKLIEKLKDSEMAIQLKDQHIQMLTEKCAEQHCNHDCELNKKMEQLEGKEMSLKKKEKLLADKEAEIEDFKESMEAELLKQEEELRKIAAKELKEWKEKQRRETSCGFAQTDDSICSTSQEIVREGELLTRIDDLESALERKNHLIQQLQERLPDETTEEIVTKKKDRSQSMTSGGVFQNFVSQMKDKREEANERSKKKEAERKAERAAREAAREIEKERSPLRSKSPSLLTRLRDRSPVKARTPNLETTPNTSTRNLLSPIDAERQLERKGSPSRALFSKKKDVKEPTTPDAKRPAWKF